MQLVMFTELLDKLTMATLKTMGLNLGYANAQGFNVDNYSYGCGGYDCSGVCGGNCSGGCDGTCYGNCLDSAR